MIALCLAGCIERPALKPSHAADPKAKPGQPLNLSEGSADVYSPVPKRAHLWSVHWMSAQLATTEGMELSGGKMQTVTGQVYEGSKVGSIFSSDKGQGDRASGEMNLSGKVRVEAKQNGIALSCDELVYRSKARLYEAQGNVRISTASGVSGSSDRILATADLKTLGTPNVFSRGAQP